MRGRLQVLRRRKGEARRHGAARGREGHWREGRRHEPRDLDRANDGRERRRALPGRGRSEGKIAGRREERGRHAGDARTWRRVPARIGHVHASRSSGGPHRGGRNAEAHHGGAPLGSVEPHRAHARSEDGRVGARARKGRVLPRREQGLFDRRRARDQGVRPAGPTRQGRPRLPRPGHERRHAGPARRRRSASPSRAARCSSRSISEIS